MLVGVSGMPPNISGDSAARLNVVTAGVAREPVSCPRPGDAPRSTRGTAVEPRRFVHESSAARFRPCCSAQSRFLGPRRDCTTYRRRHRPRGHRHHCRTTVQGWSGHQHSPARRLADTNGRPVYRPPGRRRHCRTAVQGCTELEPCPARLRADTKRVTVHPCTDVGVTVRERDQGSGADLATARRRAVAGRTQAGREEQAQAVACAGAGGGGAEVHGRGCAAGVHHGGPGSPPGCRGAGGPCPARVWRGAAPADG